MPGFTLVELSITLLVLSLIAAAGLNIGAARTDQEKIRATYAKLDALEAALWGYRATNNRLPCPADATDGVNAANFGLERVTGADCTAGYNLTADISWGVVPVKTLGLPDDAMLDAWGQRITYAVAREYATTAGPPFTAYNMTHQPAAGITVDYDESGSNRTASALYVLVSHGRNGHGGYTINGARKVAGSTNAGELINCHCTSAGAAGVLDDSFVQQPYKETAGAMLNTFDDIVRYKMRWQLFATSEVTAF